MYRRHQNDCQHLNVSNDDEKKKLETESYAYICIKLMQEIEKKRERDGEKKIDRFERLIHVELAKLLMRAQNTP